MSVGSSGGNLLGGAFVQLRADNKQLMQALQSGKADLSDVAKFMTRVEAKSNELKGAFMRLGLGTRQTFKAINQEAKLALGAIPQQLQAIGGKPTSRFVSAMQRNSFAMGQLGFAAQDFIAVMSMPGMGFAAAMRGATNNIQQMLFLMNPLIGAFAGVAVGLGVSLIPALIKAGKVAEETTDKIKEQREELERFREKQKERAEKAVTGLDTEKRGEDKARAEAEERMRNENALRDEANALEFRQNQLMQERERIQQRIAALRKAVRTAQPGGPGGGSAAAVLQKRLNELLAQELELHNRISAVSGKRVIVEQEVAKATRDRQQAAKNAVEDATKGLRDMLKGGREGLGKFFGDLKEGFAEANREARDRAEKIEGLRERREATMDRIRELRTRREGQQATFTGATGLAQSIQRSIGQRPEQERMARKRTEELEKQTKALNKIEAELRAAGDKEAVGRFAPGGE